MSEILWKPIAGYENYSVSNTGYIKNNTTQRILKFYIRNGYNSVTLSMNNCKRTVNVHVIVAETFLTKPSNGVYVVNHINEDKLDNSLANLEYVTYRENTMHSMTSARSRNSDVFNISEFADIPNYSNYMVSQKGKIYSKKLKRLCCITTIPSGYHKIKLKADTGIYKDLYVHVIIAMTYLNYIPTSNMIVINHKDANKGNNSLDNLEIITHKENMKHSITINKDTIFRKAVYYIDTNSNRVVFSSAKEASIKTGIDNSSILKSCKNDNKKAGNIKWYYMSNS